MKTKSVPTSEAGTLTDKICIKSLNKGKRGGIKEHLKEARNRLAIEKDYISTLQKVHYSSEAERMNVPISIRQKNSWSLFVKCKNRTRFHHHHHRRALLFSVVVHTETTQSRRYAQLHSDIRAPPNTPLACHRSSRKSRNRQPQYPHIESCIWLARADRPKQKNSKCECVETDKNPCSEIAVCLIYE